MADIFYAGTNYGEMKIRLTKIATTARRCLARLSFGLNYQRTPPRDSYSGRRMMFPRVPGIALSAALLMTSFNLAYAAESAEEIVVKPEASQLEYRSELVAIADLNLMTESGQATLMRRIHQAVRDVCAGPIVDNRVARETRDYHACYDAAIADATSKAQAVLASARQPNEAIAAVIVAKAANH